ncbi:site-specific integrase [Lamprobacter modestohalophilus]|uniref:tyrosine-type recombinase/integrase n=1 Tax=Lamprobacter modestohalophilus TaxID=1064514 RepID=UPI002ADEE02F|nr:site-specific integrase [Lamprobacter modestohalophilus]MEA1050458.1 site-specific integrase [Lamprobacter modestohalophilus]
MPIYQRPGSETYWIDIKLPGRARVRRSARTTDKHQAQELHDTLKAQLWRQSELGERPKHAWDDAVIRYIKELEKRSADDDRLRLRKLNATFTGRLLAEITSDEIKEAVLALPGIANATRNRYLTVVRTLFRKAANEWKWIDAPPYIKLFKEPDRRIRWITREQADRLIVELPAHLKGPAELALQTGLRQANVLGLRWEWVSFDRRTIWIPPEAFKANRSLLIPLSETAILVLRRQVDQHPERVFTHHGKPFDTIASKTMQDACARAKIESFHWHDLRHTWASWHVQAGTSLQQLMELGGWSSYTMVLKYAHLAPSHLQDAAAKVPAPGRPKLRAVE